MAFKFVVIFALLAAVNAGFVPAAPQVYHAAPVAAAATVVKGVVPVAQPVLTKTVEEYDPHPQYKFGYGVQDAVSGDTKTQVEERDGDVVRGEYTLIDADGYKRTVQYTADPVHGFNAVVSREPLVGKAVVAAPAPVVKTVAPVAQYAAPASVVKTVAPVSQYAAPAAVVKTAVPAYTTYTAPAVVKSAVPAYTTYTVPASHVANH
ncbi:larval cuticle protein A2B-like [Musca vetustissima]|uniref:larval cuticle protein A2B-like n=1 Tax=Musca vetustissima TaxID=27455 RepID=UPI002AB69385|nr:larval cuticle protein A2B-like [Musca vetustissima]